MGYKVTCESRAGFRLSVYTGKPANEQEAWEFIDQWGQEFLALAPHWYEWNVEEVFHAGIEEHVEIMAGDRLIMLDYLSPERTAVHWRCPLHNETHFRESIYQPLTWCLDYPEDALQEAERVWKIRRSVPVDLHTAAEIRRLKRGGTFLIISPVAESARVKGFRVEEDGVISVFGGLYHQWEDEPVTTQSLQRMIASFPIRVKQTD